MFAQPIVDRLLKTYPQVMRITESYYGIAPTIIVSTTSRLWAEPSLSFTPPIRIKRSEPEGDAITVGVNIGQSTLKVAICRSGVIMSGGTVIARTWQSSERRVTVDLIERIIHMITVAAAQANVPFSSLEAIGVSISSIVRSNGEILRHGVALGMEDSEYHELKQLSARLSASLGVPCIVEQDAITKAYTASILQNVKSGLIIDVGTSTGGGFTDAEGNIPEMLGQIGRSVIDISNNAVPRPDGSGVGCVSQYLSATGMLRFAASRALHIGDTKELESYIGTPAVAQLARDLVPYMFATLSAARWFHKYSTVLLSGGLVSGGFGDLLLKEVRRKARKSPICANLLFLRSLAPRFDACIGAALLAQNLLER